MRKFLPFLLVVALLAGAAFKCNEDTVQCHTECSSYAVCAGEDGLSMWASGICPEGKEFMGEAAGGGCITVCE